LIIVEKNLGYLRRHVNELFILDLLLDTDQEGKRRIEYVNHLTWQDWNERVFPV